MQLSSSRPGSGSHRIPCCKQSASIPAYTFHQAKVPVTVPGHAVVVMFLHLVPLCYTGSYGSPQVPMPPHVPWHPNPK